MTCYSCSRAVSSYQCQPVSGNYNPTYLKHAKLYTQTLTPSQIRTYRPQSNSLYNMVALYITKPNSQPIQTQIQNPYSDNQIPYNKTKPNIKTQTKQQENPYKHSQSPQKINLRASNNKSIYSKVQRTNKLNINKEPQSKSKPNASTLEENLQSRLNGLFLENVRKGLATKINKELKELNSPNYNKQLLYNTE